MERIKELSKDEKLEVIDGILSKWRKQNDDAFICYSIVDVAEEEGFISRDDYLPSEKALLATVLIPELLVFKPSNLNVSDGWFSHSLGAANIRTYVLQVLRNIISKN